MDACYGSRQSRLWSMVKDGNGRRKEQAGIYKQPDWSELKPKYLTPSILADSEMISTLIPQTRLVFARSKCCQMQPSPRWQTK